MVGVAQALAEDVQLFGVANLAEATELRAALLHPIIIFGPALPEERATIAERGFIPSISTLEEAQDFDRMGNPPLRTGYIWTASSWQARSQPLHQLDSFRQSPPEP